ncbi:MAG: phosphoenolpyruvate--protein phosphotransferase, partial [FCB group bacterium]|nr:phosphoenolpyruvate--protein phosphotransferase [FCB group bacterium]
NAAFAYRLIVNQYTELMEENQSEYFRDRVADIRDIKRRVLHALIAKQTVLSELGTGHPTIFVSREMNPTDIMMLVSEHVVGFVTDSGGITSHVAIMARTMKAPMAVGVKEASLYIESGQTLIVDADAGKVIVQPLQELLDDYLRKIDILKKEDHLFLAAKKIPPVTKDGFHLGLSANISLPFEVADVNQYGAEGIGLYRTEYLYLMKQGIPDEEELFNEYRHVVKAMAHHPVTIRTVDLGGEKIPALWDKDELRCESNPFMGYRAIRMCLDNPSVFITQIRAILRSSAYGKVSLMIPMITHLEELTASLAHIEKAKKDLKKEKLPFNESVKIGMMVETPSAVINIDAFAEKVDYLSIGTNDLTQYSLAVDRGNERVTHIYSHYDPAILKMIRKVIDAGHKADIPVYICGEMASEERAVAMFLAMGADGVSVAPRYIGTVRRFIINSNQKHFKEHLDTVLQMRTRKEITQFLDELIK